MKRYGVPLAKLAISAGLIALLLSRVDFGRVIAHSGELKLYVLPICAAVFAGQIAVAGLRLRLVLGALGVRGDWRRTVRVAWSGFFFEQVVFGFVGGDAMRVWFLRRLDIPLGRGISSVFLDRCLGFGSVTLLVVIGLRGLTRVLPDVNWAPLLWVLGAFALAGIAVAGALSLRPEALRRFPAIHGAAALAAESVRNAKSRRRLALALLLALCVHLSNVAVVSLLGEGFGLPLGIGQWFLVFPAVSLFSMIPVAAGGWGLRETAMALALHAFGVPAEQAVLPSIAFGLLFLVVSLPGGLIWMADGRKDRRDVPNPADGSEAIDLASLAAGAKQGLDA